jgi:hypothetical protein
MLFRVFLTHARNLALNPLAAFFATGGVVVYVEDCEEARTRPRAKRCRLWMDTRSNKRHLLARGLRSSGVAEGYAGQALLGHGVHFFKPNGATTSAILDVDDLRLRFQKRSSLALNQKLPSVDGHLYY